MNGLLERLERLNRAGFALVTLLLAIVFRFPSFLAPLMDSDEAVRVVGAKLLVHGGIPYLDFIDNKPPLTWFLVTLGFGSVTGARILAAVFTWATALTSGAMLYREREGVRRLASVLYLLFSAAWLDRHFLTANTEVFMNLPLAGALYYGIRSGGAVRDALRDGALTGVLFALAVLCRPTAAFAAPVVAMFWFLGPENHRELFTASALRLAGAIAGGLSVLGLAALWFNSHGALKEFLYWSFLAGGEIADTANTGFDFWRRATVSFATWLTASALLWIGAASVARSEITGKPADRDYGLLMLFWVTLITIVPCSFGGRWRGHYFLQFLPSLVPLAAVWIGRLLPRLPLTEASAEGEPVPSRGLTLIVCLALLPPLVFLTVNSAKLILDTHEDRITSDVIGLADHWKKTVPPGEKVFIWGYATGAYYLSDRMPASRYLVPVTRVSGYAYGSDAQIRGELRGQELVDPVEVEKLVRDLEKNRPAEIADLSVNNVLGFGCCPMPDYLSDWVGARYIQAGAIGKIVLWRRKEQP